MTATPQQLTERAMLIHLRISKWYPNQKDKQVQGEVTSAKHADVDAGSWTTRLVAKQHMHHIGAACSQLKTAHEIVSLPWMEGGLRILPAAMLMRYSEGIRKARANFDKAVEDFLTWYATYRVSPVAQSRLGNLIGNLPTVEEVRSKFGVQHDILPMPKADDFRVNLGDEELASLKKKMNRSIETLTANATQSLWQQMTKLVGNVKSKMDNYKDKTDDKKATLIHESLIGNLREFCEAIPALNITDDDDIAAMRQQCIDSLTAVKTESLRTDPTARQKAAQSAEDIMAQLQEYKL